MDVILAVKDVQAFHEENMAMNKSDYTYMARFTKRKVVHMAQARAARIHFNSKTMPEVYTDSEGNHKDIKVRYGIIEIDDVLRDLHYWETLMVSSFMQRPFQVLDKGQFFDEVLEKQAFNLKSAVSISFDNDF